LGKWGGKNRIKGSRRDGLGHYRDKNALGGRREAKGGGGVGAGKHTGGVWGSGEEEEKGAEKRLEEEKGLKTCRARVWRRHRKDHASRRFVGE